jgi:hypothetical protein
MKKFIAIIEITMENIHTENTGSPQLEGRTSKAKDMSHVVLPVKSVFFMHILKVKSSPH